MVPFGLVIPDEFLTFCFRNVALWAGGVLLVTVVGILLTKWNQASRKKKRRRRN
jgi:hypothetical protein